MTTSRYLVSGMTCEHCVNAVTSELKAVPGVSDVQVELGPAGTSSVSVTSENPLPVEQVAAAVDEAGYQLVGAAS